MHGCWNRSCSREKSVTCAAARMSAIPALTSAMDDEDVFELTERLDDDAPVLRGRHTISFLVTYNPNLVDSDENRARVRETFLDFVKRSKEEPDEFFDQIGRDGDLLSPALVGQVSRGPVRYSVEVGSIQHRVHVHAVVQVTGTGKIMWRIGNICEMYPHAHWDFKYINARPEDVIERYMRKSLPQRRSSRDDESSLQ